MNRKILLWAMALVVLIPTIFGGGYWLYWSQYKRFEPVIIKDPVAQVEIERLLTQAGSVSPGGTGPKLWLITYRACKTCRAYEEQEFPVLQAAGIDTRVIVIVRPDDQGLGQSTPAERATVAEIWLNRDWTLYQAWFMTRDADWKAAELKPADGDLARLGVVAATQGFAKDLTTQIAKDRLPPTYPLLFWRDANNHLKACVCTDPRSFAFVRADLGVGGTSSLSLPEVPKGSFEWPDWAKPREEEQTPPPPAAPMPATTNPATATPGSESDPAY
jgi:hypothetical protein